MIKSIKEILNYLCDYSHTLHFLRNKLIGDKMNTVEFGFDTEDVNHTSCFLDYYSGATVHLKDDVLKSIRYANGDYIEFNYKGLVTFCRTHDGETIENLDGFMSLTSGFKL